ncbi:transcription initiation factor IID, 31kD subunit-domain-containing protein [Myxozyma melibiosi]|uniref:Transcription initiation factor IID, 31kD subunit-domain-containing protein n=1 Tax=Myxozyma melibiosi TaxID=54550 RepID=A0ABR1F9K1_9ASCO
MEDSEERGPATPRDARVLHLMLASQGIARYQERVPLQLMDFAFRYSASVLEDAMLYADHGRQQQPAAAASSSALSVEDLRLAVAARLNYQFHPAPPKELLLELAHERNRRPLPHISTSSAIRLPPEKYCLTAKDWVIDEELADLPDDDDEDAPPDSKRARSS